MTHWQPSMQIEKVPIPVQHNIVLEHINEIRHDSITFETHQYGIILSNGNYLLLFCDRYPNALVVRGIVSMGSLLSHLHAIIPDDQPFICGVFIQHH
ncbi:hypothetical protein BC792_10537 [Sphingobacterium allocomposti]|uniref:Uncharacterized protein n=1 Tax=Sphingobacterium allocomposti TaxID=415956 RepID=A0A5S5DNC6_9SPHI|nr:hypothetical protein BC792_10537 [Sphingobacterium composti Yoo et al. 2007 non Ten et al. 2007]